MMYIRTCFSSPLVEAFLTKYQPTNVPDHRPAIAAEVEAEDARSSTKDNGGSGKSRNPPKSRTPFDGFSRRLFGFFLTVTLKHRARRRSQRSRRNRRVRVCPLWSVPFSSVCQVTQGYTHDQKLRTTITHARTQSERLPEIMPSRSATACFVFALLPKAYALLSTTGGGRRHGDVHCEQLYSSKIRRSDAHCLGGDEGTENSCSAVRRRLCLACST